MRLCYLYSLPIYLITLRTLGKKKEKLCFTTTGMFNVSNIQAGDVIIELKKIYHSNRMGVSGILPELYKSDC